MTENSFFHRGPIHDPTYFYGRNTEVKQVLEMLSQKMSVSITGPRKIGKTSLLLYVSQQEVMRQHGLDPTRHLLVYVNCEGLGDLALGDLHALILKEVAERAVQLGHRLAVPEHPVSYLDFKDTLRELTDSDEKLNVVLLLDEFESLSNNRELTSRLYPGLRALAQESIVICLTVSQRPLADFSEEYSPFFNIFVPLKMGLFDETESRGLMERYLSRAQATFSPEALNGILELGGGHPFFLQVVAYSALELQRVKGAPLTSQDLRILIQTVRSQVESHFDYYWRHLTTQERYVLAALSVAQSQDAHREQLKVLADHCLIVKEGDDEEYKYFTLLLRDFVRRQKAPDVLQADPFVLVLPLQCALLREKPLPLTPRLFAFLSYLVEHRGRVVSNEELDREVLAPPEERQQYQYMGDDRLKSTIRELRRALGEEADRIVNKQGVGYTLEIRPEE